MTSNQPEAPALLIEGLHKHFERRDGTKVPAVDGVNLRVERGEFVVLLGPSGCGKTTLLRCVAGLEDADEGTVTIGGEVHYSSSDRINSSPDKRKLGMVFQSYALWPHMKVSSNVAYPLRLRKVARAETRERVQEILTMVGIGDLADQYPGQLSGGQQQRVALARALVSGTELVLFDEPLSNVDAKVREQLRYEILRMQEELGFAAIYVTHDQDEAMELADRIAVLNSGKVAQLDRPEAVYEAPADRYVAKFVGGTNEISGVVKAIAKSGEATVDTDAGPVVGTLIGEGLAVGDRVSGIVRPERCELRPKGSKPAVNSWPAEFVTTMFMGDHRGIVVRVAGWGEARVHTIDSTPDVEAGLEFSAPPQYVRFYKQTS